MAILPYTTEHAADLHLRVLCVEDLPEIREVLRIFLQMAGHQVTCAEDGDVAHNLISANPDAFDLVITDHQMPVMNGLELVTCLRALPFHGKILVYSASLDSEISDAYRGLGVDGLLRKPLSPRVLMKEISSLFQESLPHVRNAEHRDHPHLSGKKPA